jgi:hypothetical protein
MGQITYLSIARMRCDSTIQRFSDSTIQRFNDSTIQRFKLLIAHKLQHLWAKT